MSTELKLAIYGAVVSTLVTAWHFWKAYKDRRWITTSWNFRGLEELGNDIVLINNSPKPLTLYHIELFWGRRFPFWTRHYQRVGVDEWSHENADTGLTINPYQLRVINYSGERHFNWRYERRSRARLYLRCQIVGRSSPKTLLIYKQNQWEPSRLKSMLSKFGLISGGSYLYLDEENQNTFGPPVEQDD